MLGKLTEIEWIDDTYCNILLKDLAGKVYQLRVNSKWYKVPSKGQILRVRAAKPSKQDHIIGTTKHPIKIEISMYSNLLHIPHYFKQSLLLSERIIEDDVLKKLILGSDMTLDEICANP